MPKRASEPDHAALVARVTVDLYGAPATAHWIPSDEADVFQLDWDGALAPRILKIQRPEMSWVVWREQAVLPELAARGFAEVPLVEYTQEDLPGSDAVFMVMPSSPSVELRSAYRESPDVIADLFERLGDFLRRLGAVPLDELPRLATPQDNNHGRFWMRSVQAVLAHPWGQRNDLRRRLEESQDVLASLPNCFGVGGHGVGLLYDGRRDYKVIDWGSAGPVWPTYDLASAVGLAVAITADPAKRLVPALLAGFRPGGRLTDDEVREWRALILLWEWYAAAQAVAAGDAAAFDTAVQEVDVVERLVEASLQP